jgi:hypothetical protein
MTIAYDVVGFYVAMAVWAVLLFWGMNRQSWKPFLIFGILFTAVLNFRYLFEGAGQGIVFFVGIYDVLVNIGLDKTAVPEAITTCAGNACTPWGDTYTHHSSWAVAFHERYTNGWPLRNAMLYTHLFFTTVAFILVHVQLALPPVKSSWHKTLGKISFVSVVIGMFGAAYMTTSFTDLHEYGGVVAELGFWAMIAMVLGTATLGVMAIRRRDVVEHRIWMFRFAGAMWGAFWVFRLQMVILDPITRNFEGLTIGIPSIIATPMGILIADMVRKQLDRRQGKHNENTGASGVVAAE